MSEPPWLQAARCYLGVAEIPGKDSAPTIQRWLRNLHAYWDDDATPWCGVFVAECLTEVGIEPPKAWYRALAYLDWGMAISAPRLGCVVVYERTGGGHVGFVTGIDAAGHILTLGGNQGDMVCIKPFDSARVAGYRWPWGVPVPTEALIKVASVAPVSSNEA